MWSSSAQSAGRVEAQLLTLLTPMGALMSFCQMGSTFKSAPHSIVLWIKWSDACWEQCVAYNLEELSHRTLQPQLDADTSAGGSPSLPAFPSEPPGTLAHNMWWNFSLFTVNTLNSNLLKSSVCLHNSFHEQGSRLALCVINCILTSFSSLMVLMVKTCLPMQDTKEMWDWSFGQEDPVEEGMSSTPVFLPGEAHGQRSLVGYGP